MFAVKRLAVLVLIYFISLSFLYAQKNYTINGVVKNSATSETLIGASVKISGVSQLGTSTNSYGFYSISLPEGQYKFEVSYVGYVTLIKEINISANVKQDFSLEESNNLNEVVITNIRRNDNVIKAQMGVEKLNIKDIQNIPVLFGEKDILKTLQLLPGIKSAGEGNSGFYVRGGSTDQNLILLDEAPVYNASHLLGFFSTFNSDAIKDVTVYKGGMPAQYGGRLSSVLDIRMNDGNKKETTFEGGIGLISSRLKIEGPFVKDKSSFMVSGRRTYADAFLALAPDTSLRGNTLYFYDLNAKANYQLDEKNTVYLSGYFGRDKLGLNETFGFNWGNATGTLRWNHLFSNKLFSNTSLIVSKYDYTIENLLSGSEFKVNSSISDFNLKQDFNIALNNKHELKFGFDALHHTIAPGQISSPSTSSVNEIKIETRKGVELAAYFSDQYNLSDKIKLVYGLRLSSFSLLGGGNFKTFDVDGNQSSSTFYKSSEIVKTYINLEPRFSASFQLDDTKSLKASYTRNVQNLHLMSNSTATSPTDLYIMNSLNTKPELADQFSLGYFNNFNDNDYEFSAETYYKPMQNQIEYRNGTDLRGNQNVEADLIYGKGRAYGIELFFKKKYGKFNGWIGYTLSKTERQFSQINNNTWFAARQDRPHDISVVGIYKPGKRWIFSSTFVYSSGNAVTFPIGKYNLDGQTVFYYGERNANRTPDFHRLDVSATLEGKPNKKFKSSWNFGICNLYNRKNPFSIDFKDNPDNTSQTQAVQTSLFGIIPSVTWNFKF
ncbi:TonB-dependent receptor [Pedobacter frigiditerrae]|uniref:TonB-dependent receptor n=1 Tax=Pedobacter frigiditerrae TaxID=2530452 RepID=A0A4R0MXE3_9SPHI|nr:TonB-dependent receptor [Pedobacter frigiditerrae]TCC90634.1 TonB-dependent receptor [Pedobacter frigiditerrae]